MHSLVVMALIAVPACASAQFRRPYHRTSAISQPQQDAGSPQPPQTKRVSESTDIPSPTATAAPPTSSGTAPSLLNQPAQPAKVSLNAGNLTIEANNSALSEILDQISRGGGMKIRGLQAGRADQRIFGTYGPGPAREVLSDLLNGSGYNVLMLGATPAGVPRELALTVRPTGGVPNPPTQSTADMREEYQENQIRPTHYAPERQNQHPHPAGERNGIRTPQQILQELQQMRQRQQEQQSQQPN